MLHTAEHVLILLVLVGLSLQLTANRSKRDARVRRETEARIFSEAFGNVRDVSRRPVDGPSGKVLDFPHGDEGSEEVNK